MQYVAIIAAVLALFKDNFSGLFKSREVKFLIIGVAAYYFYTKTKAKEDKEDIVNNLPDNDAALIAGRLHNAFHPNFSEPIFGWYPPDGTDEDAVKSIAKQMGAKKNYQAVAQAFNTLYSLSLEAELRSEGVYDLFFNTYNGVVSTPNPTPTGGSIKVMVGSEAYLSQANVNIRSLDGKVLRSSTKGEHVGKVSKIEQKTVAGITSTWATCSSTSWLFLTTDVLVSVQYLLPQKP